MVKKSIIAFFLFVVCILMTSSVFATNITNAAGNTLEGIKDGVQNMVTDTGNTMEHTKDGIGNAMENAGNGLENMARDAGNAMENAKDGITNMLHDGEDGVKRAEDDVENTADGIARGMTGTDGDGYTATRTSAADARTTAATNNATIWIVLAVAGAIIVALIWYYATQTNNTDRY